MGKLTYVLAIALVCAGLFAQSSDVSAPPAFSGSLIVEKSAAASADMGDTITVTINVINNGSSSVSAGVEEVLGNVQAVEPQPTVFDVPEGEIGAKGPSISWALDIPAGRTKSVSYKVKPLTVGMLDIGPTSVSVPGAKFYSNPLQIDIACSSAPGCNDAIGETPLTCPDKCGGNRNENTTLPAIGFTPKPVAAPVAAMPDAKALGETGGALPASIFAIAAVFAIVFVAAGAYLLFIRKK